MADPIPGANHTIQCNRSDPSNKKLANTHNVIERSSKGVDDKEKLG